MILHSIVGWNGQGASHRVIIDTPPLQGSCWSAIERSDSATETNRLTVHKALQGAPKHPEAPCLFGEEYAVIE
jgi:hypothetical protein